MKSAFTLLALLAVAAPLTACNQTPDTHDADVAAIKAAETDWVQAYDSKDLDKVASHYADDGSLLISGEPAVSGKEAIRAAFKPMFADPAFTLHFQATKVEVAKSSDVAFTQGTYTLTLTDPVSKQVIHDHGNYVTGYRKQTDGTWKAVTDAALSDIPMPPPAPTPEKKP